MNITDVCIRRPVFAWMIMLGTVLFGIIAGRRIGISQFPDVDYPNITVSISWSGAAPEEVEHGVIEPLEQAVAQVEGIQAISSSSKLGSGRITAQFAMSRNIDLALQDVQAKIAQSQRQLPQDVDPPTVSKSNPDDQPILTIGVAGPFSRQVLGDVAKYQVQQRLQTIPGVGQVTTNGYLERNIRIWVDAILLLESGTTVADVTAALTREHVQMPGGQLQTPGREISIRVLGEAMDLETLRDIIIREVNGSPIRLRDVSLVEDGFEDSKSVARADGAPMQSLGVLKQRGSNAVAVAQDVQKVVRDIQKTLPEGMDLMVLFDTTTFIEESVHEIYVELGLALILTAFVCWLFLGSFSSTMNVLMAIPMSLLGTIAVIYFCGFTLNTFTLLGLSLSVGLVVDDAVMVMENIYRHAEMGKSREVAASEGTKEITFAALAATLAVIAIFLPVIFMDGVIGRFFFQFGVTLSVAVALSYIEAITLAPARCAQILDTSRENRSWLGRTVDRLFEKLCAFYAKVLEGSLNHRWKVLAGALVMMIAAIWTALHIPSELVPSQDQSRIAIRVTTAVGTDVVETAQIVEKAEKIVGTIPEVSRTLVTLNSGSGSISLTLVPPEERKLTQAQISAQLRQKLAGIPGLRASIQDLSQQGFSGSKGSPVDISVRGPDWDKLITLSLSIKERLASSGLTADIDTDYQVGLPELDVTPDRGRASDLGIPIRDIANTISALIGGTPVGKYSSGGRRLDVRMRILKDQRQRPEDITYLHVRTADGDMVPLSQVVNIEEKPVLQAINHQDRERAIGITGNIAPGHSQSEVLAFVEEIAKESPAGYRVVFGGQSVQFQDSTNSLLFALMVGILVAYMILASQFNSLIHPITVLSILPLSVAGAAFALYLTNKTLNVFSMIGVLLLMGIVKKNSIILVDYANEVMHLKGLAAREAMLEAGPVRLRPILMTSVATMMSAVPSAIGIGAGAETRGPMSIAVLGGLMLSTFLSLLVVPAFYLVMAPLANRKKKDDPGHPTASAHEPHETNPTPSASL